MAAECSLKDLKPRKIGVPENQKPKKLFFGALGMEIGAGRQ